MDSVQDRRHEHKGELDRLGDAGQERSQRGGDHDAAHFCTVFRFRGVPDSDRSSRQTVHFEQEAARKFACGRVARHVARDIAVEHLSGRVGEFTNLHLERHVPDMMQAERHQRTLNHAIDTKGDDRVLVGCPLGEVLNRAANRRPNKGEDHAQNNRRHTGDNRYETFTGKEAQIFRQLDAIEAVKHISSDRTSNNTA